MKDIIIRNAIMTPDGTFLRSYHRHDYKEHKDAVTNEVYVVDGGNDYLRRSVNVVEATDMTVYLDDDFQAVRQAFVWKSYGKNLEHMPNGIYIALCDMEDEHIYNILQTQQHIKGSFVEKLFKDELKYRLEHQRFI
jgi:hypothetical protein